MRKLLLAVTLPPVALAAASVSLAATPNATAPPLNVRIYDAQPGGFHLSFWMSHSTGWKWSGTAAGANRLGCAILGTYNGDAAPAPGQVYHFSATVKPTASPYKASISLGHFDNGPITINSTCTLRRLNAQRVWVYKTVKSAW